MANEGEYKSKIGLDSLYVAEVTADDVGGYTADTPAWLAPAHRLPAAARRRSE